jgi:hypothetical protein
VSKDIAARFKRETATHEMTVLHDDGLYRHLCFQGYSQKPDGTRYKTDLYWFELITAPGALIFQGDGESYVFRRVPDMFEFFRDSAWGGQPNVGYWAEKMTDGRDRVMVYQQDMLKKHVRDAISGTKLDGLEEAVTREVLDEMLGDETYDRKLVDDFRFYVNDLDRYDYKKRPDFEFTDSYEWNCRDYHWWFLWALHGIVWGIAQYDAHRAACVGGEVPA